MIEVYQFSEPNMKTIVRQHNICSVTLAQVYSKTSDSGHSRIGTHFYMGSKSLSISNFKCL